MSESHKTEYWMVTAVVGITQLCYWMFKANVEITHTSVLSMLGWCRDLSLNREGRWGTTDDFATSFLQFSLFSTALWDLANCSPVLSIPWCCDAVFPPLPLSALSSSPFHCALKDGFGQTWWTGNVTIPLQLAPLYGGQEIQLTSW